MFWLFLIINIFVSPTFAAEPIVKISNYSSNSSPEWVEIQNQTDTIINLQGWKIRDGNTDLSDDLTLSGCLSPHSYLTAYQINSWLNNIGDTIAVFDSNNIQIDQLIYTAGKIEISPRSDNNCVPTLTPSPIPPTPTPTPFPPTSTPTVPSLPTLTPSPTNTPTPTSTITSTPTPTGTVTPQPTTSPTNIPLIVETPIMEPTPQIDSAPAVLAAENSIGISDIIKATPTSTFGSWTPSSTLISVGFIGGGCLLLFVPLLILKFKK